MKTLGRCSAVVVGLLVTTGVAGAQSPPNAGAVLAKVQQFYSNANQLTAQFRQVVTNATFNTSRTNDGLVWVSKPSSFRFDYLAKKKSSVVATKSFIFDGTTLWYVDHGNKQIFQNQTQGNVLPAAVSFLTGGNALTTQFNVSFNTAGKYGGKSATVLELTPKQASAQYKQLFFVVDATDWHIRESIVIDSNGDTNDFKYFTPNLQATVKSALFQVNPASLPTYKVVVVQSATGSATGSGSGAVTPAAGLPAAGSGAASGTMPTPKYVEHK